ncbi:Uncharacterized protein APZ42_004302 [Daphnia magna]|uniref:Secreted protein n=1 Tax=Daphnia magna TaxID=35525 RepID=A0A164H578_9CRUS|nr:Uncharacterized protein APZ42_004302 [Daphnia magna]
MLGLCILKLMVLWMHACDWVLAADPLQSAACGMSCCSTPIFQAVPSCILWSGHAMPMIHVARGLVARRPDESRQPQPINGQLTCIIGTKAVPHKAMCLQCPYSWIESRLTVVGVLAHLHSK